MWRLEYIDLVEIVKSCILCSFKCYIYKFEYIKDDIGMKLR